MMWRASWFLSAGLAIVACERASEATTDRAGATVLPALATQDRSNADAQPPAIPFSPSTPMFAPEVLHVWPHDAEAFTQGLAFVAGRLYESTGLDGRSQVRELDPRTLVIRRRIALPPAEFGEGIAAVRDRLYQLTWLHGSGHVYDVPSLAPVDSFRYDGEGWGLATDGRSLFMSDGSSQIRVIDPAGFRERRRIQVEESGHHVWALNELEWVHGELWANVYQTTFIARIDPTSGRVIGWVDLAHLDRRFTAAQRTAVRDGGGVANGIAFDSTSGRLLVTGKLWPQLFQVTLPPPR